LLQPGTITREKHRNELSMLDLVLCTPELALQTAKYIVIDAFYGSNYLLIKTEFLIGNLVRKDLEMH